MMVTLAQHVKGIAAVDTTEKLPSIKVVSMGGGNVLGGAGWRVVNDSIEEGFPGAEFMALDTDSQDLKRSKAPVHLLIGSNATQGRGASEDPHLGEQAGQESAEEIAALLRGADLVIRASRIRLRRDLWASRNQAKGMVPEIWWVSE